MEIKRNDYLNKLISKEMNGLATTLKEGRPQNVLTFIGLLPVALFGIYDILAALNCSSRLISTFRTSPRP